MKSPCSRRKFGAVIVKDGAIVSTGYNGSARGSLNCGVDIKCLKDICNEERYTSYVNCPAIHAEQNAVINAARSGVSIFGGILYLASMKEGDGDRPCHLCRRTIINSGLKDCFYLDKTEQLIYEEVGSWAVMEDMWIREIIERMKESANK